MAKKDEIVCIKIWIERLCCEIYLQFPWEIQIMNFKGPIMSKTTARFFATFFEQKATHLPTERQLQIKKNCYLSYCGSSKYSSPRILTHSREWVRTYGTPLNLLDIERTFRYAWFLRLNFSWTVGIWFSLTQPLRRGDKHLTPTKYKIRIIPTVTK